MDSTHARPRSSRRGDPAVAVAYLRVSTDEQRLGPDAQRAAIEVWAARAGVRVASWHCDQGVSGGAAIDARPPRQFAEASSRTARGSALAMR